MLDRLLTKEELLKIHARVCEITKILEDCKDIDIMATLRDELLEIRAELTRHKQLHKRKHLKVIQ